MPVSLLVPRRLKHAALAVMVLVRQRLISVAQPEAGQKTGGDALVVERIHQTATRDGRTEWSLDAAWGQYLMPEKKIMLKDLSVTFFGQDGQQVYLTSRKGTVQTDSHDMEARDEVVIYNDLYRLKTDQIQYVHGARMITSETPVKLTGQTADIMADSLSLDLNTHSVEFSGQVRVVRESYTLTADSLSIFFKPPAEGESRLRSAGSAKDPSKIAAGGRVVIRSQGLTAFSDAAEYDPESGRTSLWGEKTAAARSVPGGGIASATGTTADGVPPTGKVRIVLVPTAKPR